MNINRLAEQILIALYSNPNVEPEDYEHNVTVARETAECFIRNTTKENDWGTELQRAINNATTPP